MSKSLGNVFTIDDILKRSFNPRAVRLLFLTAHFRSEISLSPWRQQSKQLKNTFDDISYADAHYMANLCRVVKLPYLFRNFL